RRRADARQARLRGPEAAPPREPARARRPAGELSRLRRSHRLLRSRPGDAAQHLGRGATAGRQTVAAPRRAGGDVRAPQATRARRCAMSRTSILGWVAAIAVSITACGPATTPSPSPAPPSIAPAPAPAPGPATP